MYTHYLRGTLKFRVIKSIRKLSRFSDIFLLFITLKIAERPLRDFLANKTHQVTEISLNKTILA